MSNHRARTWDHRGSKSFSPKLLQLSHHLDDLFLFSFDCIHGVSLPTTSFCLPSFLGKLTRVVLLYRQGRKNWKIIITWFYEIYKKKKIDHPKIIVWKSHYYEGMINYFKSKLIKLYYYRQTNLDLTKNRVQVTKSLG
jgi:hypothetical protein